MKTRKKILIRILSLTAVLVVGLFVGLFVWGQLPTQFTIAVTGQPGLAFNGVIKANGAVMSVSGVVPTNYVVTARSVDCRFQKQGVGGEIGVCVRMKYLNGTCMVTAPEAGSGVAAFVSLHSGNCHTF